MTTVINVIPPCLNFFIGTRSDGRILHNGFPLPSFGGAGGGFGDCFVPTNDGRIAFSVEKKFVVPLPYKNEKKRKDMSTTLFHETVYGPVRSRRLGVSLGVNISPADGKRCTFNCIYCECGLNEERPASSRAPRREEVRAALEERLRQMADGGVMPDVITFSGNGEPTLHPAFAGIIDDTLALRDRLCPQARVAVLSNSTMIGREEVFRALCRVDENIMKLDAATDVRMRQIDQPEAADFTCRGVVDGLCRFDGRVIIQTIFLRGERDGVVIDNTAATEVGAWLEALRLIRPHKVMIYTIDRETPVKTLRKVLPDELEAIAVRVRAAGFEVSVAT
jgi:wyosine [tRNA(Phe)-imidazoG37] synthetase (radical SAM superfamily)